jgi:hypothetical protein
MERDQQLRKKDAELTQLRSRVDRMTQQLSGDGAKVRPGFWCIAMRQSLRRCVHVDMSMMQQLLGDDAKVHAGCSGLQEGWPCCWTCLATHEQALPA